jgi:hypothetical protein
MATPAHYDIAGLLDRGNKWFAAQLAETPEAVMVRAALAKRGYNGKKDAKGKVLIPDHNAEGVKLFEAFKSSADVRAKARPSRMGKVTAEDVAAADLRTWIRDGHAELLGIKRNVANSGLDALSTLDELDTASGLRHSAMQMIALFASPELQPALAPYALSSADADEGKALLKAWDEGRNHANLARGGEKGSMQQNISDREKFAAWLGVWWAIAKVRLRTQPASLETLGVEMGNIRAKRGSVGPA